EMNRFINEFNVYYASRNLPLGTPVKDWDEIDRQAYEAKMQAAGLATVEKRCLLVEDDHTTKMVTIQDGEVKSQYALGHTPILEEKIAFASIEFKDAPPLTVPVSTEVVSGPVIEFDVDVETF